jgi:hypothetical protein
MSRLSLCVGCKRHVRGADAECPFCGTSLQASQASTSVRATDGSALGSRPQVSHKAGLKRAALFALGASVNARTSASVVALGASLSAAACGQGDIERGATGSNTSAATTATTSARPSMTSSSSATSSVPPTTSIPSVMPVYGAPVAPSATNMGTGGAGGGGGAGAGGAGAGGADAGGAGGANGVTPEPDPLPVPVYGAPVSPELDEEGSNPE